MFVVYSVKTGKTCGVYQHERSAKSQVTRNNRKLMMQILKGREYFYCDHREEEWAHCSYADYAPHFWRFYSKKPLIY